MKFMDEVIAYSKEAWDDAANERFLNEMADGTLSREKFRDYMVQDSIYLRDYLKTFAYAMAKSRSWKEMQLFYSMLGYVTDGENTTRLTYLAEWGLTDADIDKIEKRPQCRDYTSFLIETGKNGTVEEILMAVLPCLLGYYDVFMRLKARAPLVAEGYFAPLVADYTSEGYGECCAYWTELANEMCGGFDKTTKEHLKEIFYLASMHELHFWQMAGEERR